MSSMLLRVFDCAASKSSIYSISSHEKANQSGSAKIQLQIAAREGAAREVYKSTGIDVMQHLDRLKPAVLQLNPPADSEGKKPLKNEHENRLYYFLQVSEDDFAQNVSLSASSVQKYTTMTLKQFSMPGSR